MRPATMKKSEGVALFVCVLGQALWLTATGADAQLLKYGSRYEVYGAAAASPESTRQILRRLAGLCSQYEEPAQPAVGDAVGAWETRHHEYLDENARIKQELLSLANNPAIGAADRQRILRLYEATVPNFVNSYAQSLTFPITAAPDKPSRVVLCGKFAQAIAAGQFDLQANDPVVASFLDERIRKRKQEAQSPQ